MFTKATSKAEFFDQNRALATSLAEKERNERIERIKAIDVRISTFLIIIDEFSNPKYYRRRRRMLKEH
jgi:hypothetical protein